MIKAGFSRDTSNTISNIISLLVISLTFKITTLISNKGRVSSLKVIFSVQSAVYLFNIVVFSQLPYLYAFTETFSQILIAAGNITLYIYIY